MEVIICVLTLTIVLLLGFLLRYDRLLMNVRKELQKEANRVYKSQTKLALVDRALQYAREEVPDLNGYSTTDYIIHIYALVEMYINTNNMLKEAWAKANREQAARQQMLEVDTANPSPYVDKLERLLQEITDDNIGMKVTFDYRLGALRAVRKIREWLYVLKTTLKTDTDQRV